MSASVPVKRYARPSRSGWHSGHAIAGALSPPAGRRIARRCSRGRSARSVPISSSISRRAAVSGVSGGSMPPCGSCQASPSVSTAGRPGPCRGSRAETGRRRAGSPAWAQGSPGSSPAHWRANAGVAAARRKRLGDTSSSPCAGKPASHAVRRSKLPGIGCATAIARPDRPRLRRDRGQRSIDRHRCRIGINRCRCCRARQCGGLRLSGQRAAADLQPSRGRGPQVLGPAARRRRA